jgi:RNA polymerase sigma-70 factor (ECF subfamily)
MRLALEGRIVMMETEIITDAIIENKEWLYKQAFAITKNKEEAEDAVSNAIVKAYVSEGKLSKKESINSWLYKIVHNESYNIIRKRKDLLNIEDYENSLFSKDNIEKSMEERSIWDIVLDLPEKYREVIYLFYAREFDMKTIHRITGLSMGTIKSRLSRAREMLRLELWEGGNDDGVDR